MNYRTTGDKNHYIEKLNRDDSDMRRLATYKIGRTEWVIRYIVLDYFCVYKNGKLAKDLYMENEFETESNAMLAILKYYQI